MSFNEQHALETYKSLISISVEALKALLLLNGGAVVVVLAYLGQAKSVELAPHAKIPLAWFVAGLVTAGLAFITSYFTQLALYNECALGQTYTAARHEHWFARHEHWLWATAALGVASLASFAFGGFSGVSALSYQ